MEKELKQHMFDVKLDFDPNNDFLIYLTFQLNCLNNLPCFLCKKDVSKTMKFLCEECNNQVFCINCLVTKRHSVEHEFHILDNLNFSLFTKDWKIMEEYKLLQNLEVSGLNNWEDIKYAMENKGEIECESHYYSFYCTKKDCPLPEENSMILDVSKNIIEEKLNKNKETQKNKLKEYFTNFGSFPLLLNNIKVNKTNGLLYPAELLGYNPKRNEFDKEYLNHNEILLTSLEFDDNDKRRRFRYKI